MLDKRIVRPYPKNWQGSIESRPFRLGETIEEKLSEYAEKEKLEVFWRLNRDYVVKDAFRINKTILKTALQLGQGISGHFQNGVSIYFCYSSRSIVVIEGTKSYLNDRCSLLKSNSGY
ncbi:TcpQ domain-containing protein [Pseudocolwellia sp. HL-MZ7]|uniref:TcpQ domain-containing protein n=1 Tax=Pseudocolwellia sp. HL-MZ7 TaxID=3400627 RepID=UPI003CEFF565